MKTRWKLNPDAIIDDNRFKKVLDAADAKAIHLGLMIAGNMGWRVGEVVHIKVTDVDRSGAMIRKGVLKKRGGETVYVQKPINPVVMDELVRFMGRRKDGWLFPSSYGKVCDVFSKPKYRGRCDGGHLTKRTMQNGFTRACEKAGLPIVKGRGIHSLRHCFAFRVAQMEKDPHTVRDLLDQEGIEVAASYVGMVNQKAVMARLGGIS